MVGIGGGVVEGGGEGGDEWAGFRGNVGEVGMGDDERERRSATQKRFWANEMGRICPIAKYAHRCGMWLRWPGVVLG